MTWRSCCVEQNFECAAVETVICSRRVFIVQATWRRQGVFFKRLNSLLGIISNDKISYTIGRDFNINLLNNDRNKLLFISMLESLGAKVTINEPTRITSSTRTCIDDIITNVTQHEAHIEESNISDHAGQILKLPLYGDFVKNVTKLDGKYLINKRNSYLDNSIITNCVVLEESLIKIIRKLYEDNVAYVKIDGRLSKPIKTTMGLRQGCSL
ncbi:hypothetical protein HHI36_000177 [Cryptolaemus montrouzieri]|uniref:Reverse transcriptase n=1 Tax=Cryptolaemus montrouzieri TaxID=559131 RepID=A0ABD2P488_9CUCU